MSQFQRTTIHLGEGRYFDLRKTGLFVVTGSHGESRENPFGVRVRKREVLSRGRMIDGNTLRVVRSKLPATKVRDLLQAAGYQVKVISAVRR